MIDVEKLMILYNYLINEEKLKDAPVFKLYSLKRKSKWLMVWGTILSSRTTDKALIKVLPILEKNFSNPLDVLKVSKEELEIMFKPLGFYKNKAKIFWDFNKVIVEKYNCEIPDNLEELVKLPGIGLKVGSIILNDLFGQPLIGVDVHVFRILNRFGVLKTKDPNQAWKILHSKKVQDKIPKQLYLNLNRYLVAFGQTICKVKPSCLECNINKNCQYFISSKKVF